MVFFSIKNKYDPLPKRYHVMYPPIKIFFPYFPGFIIGFESEEEGTRLVLAAVILIVLFSSKTKNHMKK